MKQNLFKWVAGDKETGYSIFTLAWVAKCRVPFDCYIIKYPAGSYIPPHRDKLKNGSKHYRINIILTHPPGGQFVCEKPIYQSKWINFFRPDLSLHSVTLVESGVRYVLSIGWAWKPRSKK